MWRLFAAFAVICFVLLLWPDALDALRWQRGAISDGEWWRMLSAHFAHLDAWHACANLAGMALVIDILGEATRPAEALLVMLAGALAIIAGLAIFNPAVAWYAGLSGVVHGLWAGLALLGWLRQRQRQSQSQSQSQDARAPQLSLPVAALSVLAMKLMLPSLPSPALARGLPVVPQSHLYGALGGAVAALVLFAASSRDAMRMKFGLE